MISVSITILSVLLLLLLLDYCYYYYIFMFESSTKCFCSLWWYLDTFCLHQQLSNLHIKYATAFPRAAGYLAMKIGKAAAFSIGAGLLMMQVSRYTYKPWSFLTLEGSCYVYVPFPDHSWLTIRAMLKSTGRSWTRIWPDAALSSSADLRHLNLTRNP